MLDLPPYEPRPLRFIRNEQLGDWQVKVYGIATAGNEARAELVEATVSLAARALPTPPAAYDAPGISFVIAHDAATVCFALVYWWQSQNELHQRVWWSPLDNPTDFQPVVNPAAGCVWELGIIDFERRAWIDDVLANPVGPDVPRYLERHLNADV